MYRDNARFENKDAQTAYLKEHMDKLFPSGYPYEFIDKLEGK
jgi:hypothetical protein